MTTISAKVQMEVLNPVSALAMPKTVVPARRPDTLSGKRIALWWNSKDRGDIALDTVAEKLEQQYKNIEFVRFYQQYDVGRVSPEYWDKATESKLDAAIITSGD